MTDRSSWDDWALGLARAVATRADCTRRKVGAVILDTEQRVASTGYNGSPPGGPSCLRGECPRGQHYRVPRDSGPDVCACGKFWPCPDAVEPGASYDTGAGACVALHAEQNAILYADRARLDGATLYLTDAPCDGCMRMIKATRIARIVWPERSWYREELEQWGAMGAACGCGESAGKNVHCTMAHEFDGRVSSVSHFSEYGYCACDCPVCTRPGDGKCICPDCDDHSDGAVRRESRGQYPWV